VVLLAWCNDPADPQHAISAEALQLLEQETDAKGRKLQVIKLLCPPPLERTEEEWSTLVSADILMCESGCQDLDQSQVQGTAAD
jgi:agmatine deiminase